VSLVPNTHLAEGKLVQTTETEDFTLPFEYDTNERTLPLQCTQFYVKNLFDALVEAHKDQKKLSNPQPTPPAQTLFFEKKADAKTVGTPHIPPNTPTKPMLSSAGTAPASLLPLSGTPQSLSFGTKLITTPPRTLHPTSPVPMSAPNTPIGQTSLSSQPMTPSTPVQLSFTSTLQNKTPSWSLVQSKFIQSPKAPNKGSPLVSTPSQSMHLSFVASVASTPQVPTQKSVSRTSNRAQPKQLNFLSPPAKTPLAKQSAAGSSGSPVVSRQLDFGSPVKGTSSPTPAKLIAKNGMFSPSPLKWVVKNSSPSNGSPRSNSPVGKKLRFGHDY
jgi:hypothetical protein